MKKSRLSERLVKTEIIHNKTHNFSSRILKAEPFLWVAPAIIVMIGVIAYPMIISLYNSFIYVDKSGAISWVGLLNYSKLLRQHEFLISLRNTFVFTISTVALQIILGLVSALVLDKIKFIKNLFHSIVLIPMMLTPVIVALIWKMFWDADFGVINSILKSVGLPTVAWLANIKFALWAVVITDLWQSAPYVTMILLAGIQGIPKEPYEGAAIDGASSWQLLRYITLPLLKPVILFTLIIRTIFAFRTFETVFVLTSGGPANSTLLLSIYIFRLGFRYFQTNTAMALSWIMLIISLIITLVYIRLLRTDEGVRE